MASIGAAGGAAEGGEELSPFERNVRRSLEFAYRFVLSVFVSCQLFDFLFSPIWMHGYLWCLNQPIDLNMSDKTAGVILDHQLERVGYVERLLHSVLAVCGEILLLRLCGYSHRNHTIWDLLRLSVVFGAFAGIARCVQLQHRLYSAFHEIFFAYLNFFLVGACLTLRITERFVPPFDSDNSTRSFKFPKPAAKTD